MLACSFESAVPEGDGHGCGPLDGERAARNSAGKPTVSSRGCGSDVVVM